MEFRTPLLSAGLAFVQQASKLEGISRIALIGSLTTSKVYPKDIDLLVTISEEMDLTPLATLTRKLLGKTMALNNHGTDVFLANPDHQYLGRVCQWKICAAGVRRRCEAQHCGLRHFLYDDLQNIWLNPVLVAEPPLELWPRVVARVRAPRDVENILLKPLREGQK
jgi:hypothetical protein